MRKNLLALSLGMALSAAMAFAGTWTGYVSDAKCGAKHNTGSDADVACVKGGIKGGSEAVLVVGDKVVTIANKEKVAEFYGKKVTVTGSLSEEKLTVETAKAAE